MRRTRRSENALPDDRGDQSSERTLVEQPAAARVENGIAPGGMSSVEQRARGRRRWTAAMSGDDDRLQHHAAEQGSGACADGLEHAVEGGALDRQQREEQGDDDDGDDDRHADDLVEHRCVVARTPPTASAASVMESVSVAPSVAGRSRAPARRRFRVAVDHEGLEHAVADRRHSAGSRSAPSRHVAGAAQSVPCPE